MNWLSPVKVRTTLIGGEKKMLVWNDLEADEKIKIYDKGVRCHQPAGRLQPAGELPLRRHVGAAGGAGRGAAARKLAYFVDCITNDKDPFNDGAAGLRVVKMLEAATNRFEKGRTGLSVSADCS